MVQTTFYQYEKHAASFGIANLIVNDCIVLMLDFVCYIQRPLNTL